MVVRAVSVIFLSVYLMAGNHLTVSAANGEKISEDSDFSVSGENMDSLLNSLDLSRIEAFLREAGGSAVPGFSFREILSMLLSGNYQSVVRMLMDFCRTALFREISENGRWMGQVILLGILGAVFASFSGLFADSQSCFEEIIYLRHVGSTVNRTDKFVCKCIAEIVINCVIVCCSQEQL